MHDAVLLIELVRPNRSVTVAILFHGLSQRIVLLVRVVLLHLLAQGNAVILHMLTSLGASEGLVVLLILLLLAPVES